METEEYLGFLDCNLERNIFEIKHDCRNDRSAINISGIFFFPPHTFIYDTIALSLLPPVLCKPGIRILEYN